MPQPRAAFVCVDRYQLFGRLSFYAPDLRDRLWLEPDGRRRFPWLDDRKWEGRSALLVSDSGPDPVAAAPFRTVRFLGTATIPSRPAAYRGLRFSVGEGYLAR